MIYASKFVRACLVIISLAAGNFAVGIARDGGGAPQKTPGRTSGQVAPSLAGRRWRITEIEGSKVETDSAVMEFDAKENRFTAKICNGMSGEYTQRGASLKLSNPIGTLMACAGPINSTEAAFQEAVVKVTRAESKGDDLMLMAGTTAVMKLTAAPRQAAQNVATLGGAKWVVTEIEGEAITPTDRAPFLQFDKEKMTYSGFAGCNRVMGKYETGGGDVLKLGGGAMTRMACLDAASGELETKMTRALGKVNRHEITDDTLRLYAGANQLLVLKSTGK